MEKRKIVMVSNESSDGGNEDVVVLSEQIVSDYEDMPHADVVKAACAWRTQYEVERRKASDKDEIIARLKKKAEARNKDVANIKTEMFTLNGVHKRTTVNYENTIRSCSRLEVDLAKSEKSLADCRRQIGESEIVESVLLARVETYVQSMSIIEAMVEQMGQQ